MTDLPSTPSSAPVSRDSAAAAGPVQGVALAMGATGIWAMFPLVFKTVAHIPSLEVLAHRALWALLFAALLMAVTGRREAFSRAFYAPRILAVALVACVAVAVNWGVFIWAVAHDQVLQSSLGYYINPLVSVLLGVLVLREKLRTPAWAAIALAAAGGVVLVVRVGAVPWVSLALAFSWAIYGLVRKRAAVGSLPGLFLETLLLAPLALGYVSWLHVSGANPAFGQGLDDSLRLALTGAATALPLLLFARATRILQLTTIGVLMYTVPTGQFLLAVFAFGEPFTQDHLWAFALIWVGLAIYGWDSLRGSRRAKTVPLA